MNTAFLLMAQYDGVAVIPVEWVCRDYFRHLKPENFIHKAEAGDIDLPVVRMGASQKAAKGVYITDLAAYIDRQRQQAQKEYEQLRRVG